jgi:hypothetical protein
MNRRFTEAEEALPSCGDESTVSVPQGDTDSDRTIEVTPRRR